MRSEPTSVERLQFLRGAPAPLMEQDNTPLTALENERTRRGFWRVSGLIAGVVVIGIAAVIVWQLAGPQTSESAGTFASPSSLSAGSRATGGELDRVARELEGLKATVGEWSAAQREMAAAIADLQAAQQQLRADQNELAQRAAAVQAPAAFSNALDIGNAAPPAPAAAPPAPRAAQPQRQTSSPQTPRAPAVPPPPRP